MPLKVHTYFPLLGQYLWMKIDFMATVQGINDPEALAVAEKLAEEAKTYIVYLRSNHEPPLAWDEASSYTVDIVAHGPRLVDNMEGFTSDMYVPVHPFTHPVHQSVRPERDLPFPDCSHWFYAAVEVAVQRVAEGLDNNRAYQVPLNQVDLIEEAHWKELGHHMAQRHENLTDGTKESHSAPTPAPFGPSSPTHDASSAAPGALHSGRRRPQTFGYEHYFEEFVPLVNVGIDIEDRFAESDRLPTVYDFFEERAKLKRILTLDRAVELDRLAAVSSSSIVQPSDSQDSQDSPAGESSPPHPHLLRSDCSLLAFDSDSSSDIR